MMKRVLRSIALLLVLCILLSAGIAIILNTEPGTRWALARIAGAVPGQLRTGEFDGTLWRGLTFTSVTYTDERQRFEADDLEVRIQWSALSAGHIPLETVNARHVSRTSLVPPAAEKNPFVLSMQPMRVGIVVTRGSIGELVLVDAANRREVSAVEFQNLRLYGNTLRIRDISAAYESLRASISRFSSTLAGDVPVRADVSWQYADGAWSGDGEVRGSLAELSFLQAISGDYPGNAAGIIRILDRVEPDIDARFYWDSWTVGEVILRKGEVQLRGLPDRYTARYTVSVFVDDVHQYRLQGSADGDTQSVSTFTANLAGSVGQAELGGSMAWRPALHAQLDIAASDIDPALFHEELRGRLNANAKLEIDDQRVLYFSALNIDGVLNDTNVVAGGELVVSPALQRCKGCFLNVGDNRIRLNGDLTGDRVSLAVSLDAPVLAQLWPGLDGSAAGTGSINGTIAAPRIVADATLRDFAYRETAYGALQIGASGSISEIDVEADWNYRDIAAGVRGSVRVADDALAGTVGSATFREAKAGSWTLEEPFSFHVARGSVAIGAHRWSGSNGDIHVTQATMLDDDLRLAASIENIPLQLANAALPGNFQLQGYASAAIDVQRQAGQWTGPISWLQSGTALRVVEANGDVTNIVIPRAEFRADLHDGGVSASAALSVEPGVLGELELTVDRMAIDAPMRGSLSLQGDDWSWISAAVPQIDRFEGSIAAAVTADGPLNAPGFSGSIEWHDGRLTVPALNVPLDDIEVIVAGASDGDAAISGSAKAGNGELRVEGSLHDVMRASRSMVLNVSGKGAELINWPEYRLWGSPDIRLVGDAGGWRINGELTVPRADIALREAPVGAVTVSPDVVVLGEESVDKQSTRLTGETRLLLGDKVRFKALGLDTRLTGNVLVKMPVDRPLTAEGRLTLVEGTFGAHGQKLTIECGELIFTGPLDNPLVDVRAVRVIDTFEGTVTAGIHLRGRAQDLTTTVYSEPSMADADALSYLVIGRPLNQATESDGGELSGAAVALGLRQATRITEQIGQTLGLDQLSLAGDGGDTTALVAGKQINSRLYARYAYGVFSRLGTLLMRYRLSRALTLEAGAGENQSIDVLYSIEK